MAPPIVAVLAVVAAAAVLTPQAKGVAPDAEADWLRAHAVPFADPDTSADFRDLQPLKTMIGDARIVALGEGTHGTHEFFAMKRRLTEFLAREMGFTLFTMEGNLPEGDAIGEYVRSGRGDATALVKGLRFWTATTHELLGLVTWMRQYREEGGRMDFAGIDMQLPAAAEQAVLAFLRARQSDLLSAVEPAYARLIPRDTQFGLGYVELPAAGLAGKRVVLRGWVRGDSASPFAGLHLRANDGAGNALARATSTGADALSGTHDWTPLSIALDVPAGAATIRMGFVLFGTGTAWFDDAELIVDNASVRPLSFESDSDAVVLDPRSQAMPYALRSEETVVHGGRRSMKITRTGAAPLTGAEATAVAVDVAARLRAARATLLATSAPADEVDTILHYADVVRQSFEWQADATRVSREVSMAENLKWLLDRRPAGTKVIVWAHNGHVARDPDTLGSEIEKRYPGQMVTAALTASAGQYRAETPTGQVEVFTLRTPVERSVESIFDRAGLPRFVLDMRLARPADPASRWLTEARPIRYIGITGTDQQFTTTPASRSWDLAIHFKDSRPSALLK